MPRANVRRLAWVVLVILLVAWGLGARAGWAAQVDPMPVPQDSARLKTSLEERWRVIPLQNGLLLVPRRPSGTIKGIELTRDTIAIDGQIVTGGELQNRLGADADAVLKLSYLSPSERAELFRSEAEPVERGNSASARTGSKASSARSSTTTAVGVTPSTQTGSPWTEVMPIARGDRIRVGGDASVDESEQVRSLVAIVGSADVKGIVAHDVFALGGDVRLGPKAVVRGSVTTVGGQIHADPGSRIDGEITELSLSSSNLRVWLPAGSDPQHGNFSVAITPDWPRIARLTFGTSLFIALGWFVLCAGTLIVMPTGVARAREGMAWSPLGAFLVGLGTQLLFTPAMLLIATVLSVSVIGIPLLAAIPVATCALAIAGLLGYTGVLVSLGERLVGRGMPMLSLMIGATLVSTISVGGLYVWMMRGGASGIGLALALIGLGIEYVAATFGLGGALLAWTLARRRARDMQLAPVTPSGPLPLDF